MRIAVDRHVGNRLYEHLDALPRAVIRNAGNSKSVFGYVELTEICTRLRIPVETMAFMNRNGSLRRHAQEPRLHIRKILPYCLGNANDAVDAGIQKAHP